MPAISVPASSRKLPKNAHVPAAMSSSHAFQVKSLARLLKKSMSPLEAVNNKSVPNVLASTNVQRHTLTTQSTTNTCTGIAKRSADTLYVTPHTPHNSVVANENSNATVWSVTSNMLE